MNKNILRSPDSKSFSKELLGIILVVPILVFFSTYNLGGYPTVSGWDEGIYLQFASNLAHHGEYGTLNGNKFERLSPPGGTGPTLVFPIALIFWLFGDNLVYARIIMILYLVMSIIAIYLLLRSVDGWPAAIVGILIFLLTGYESYNTLWLGRQVLAEIPAIAFLIFGIWFWYKSWRGSFWYLLLSALFCSLSVVTKNQFIWLIIPSVVLLYLFDKLYYHQMRLIHSLVIVLGSLAGFVIWYIISLKMVGTAEASNYLNNVNFLARGEFLHFNPSRWIQNAKYLIKYDQSVLLIITILYGIYRSRERSERGLLISVLTIFSIIGLISFITMSTPWPRLIYPNLVLPALLIPIILTDIFKWISVRVKPRIQWVKYGIPFGAVALIAINLYGQSNLIINTHDSSSVEFATYINNNVPTNKNILNWEWEIEFFTDTSFVHPPCRLFSAMVDQVYNQNDQPILKHTRIPSAVDYLIVGPFAEQTRAFTDELAIIPHELIYNVGPYKLYSLSSH